MISAAADVFTGQQLVKLDLSDNPMTSEVAAELAQTLRQQPLLRVLNLNDTSLGDEGVSTVSAALAESQAELEQLELALNEISPAGAEVSRHAGRRCACSKP